jgi:hypothetical protein
MISQGQKTRQQQRLLRVLYEIVVVDCMGQIVSGRRSRSRAAANLWFDDSIEGNLRNGTKRNETGKGELNAPRVKSCLGRMAMVDVSVL